MKAVCGAWWLPGFIDHSQSSFNLAARVYRIGVDRSADSADRGTFSARLNADWDTPPADIKRRDGRLNYYSTHLYIGVLFSIVREATLAAMRALAAPLSHPHPRARLGGSCLLAQL